MVFSSPQYGHNYVTFDTVSLVPYDRKLIDTTLLSSEQVRYHMRLQSEQLAILLEYHTQPIQLIC